MSLAVRFGKERIEVRRSQRGYDFAAASESDMVDGATANVFSSILM